MSDGGTTTTTTTTPPAWHAGIEGEDLGHLQNRGWDKLPADKAAVEAYRAFRSAEGRLGVPADRLVTLPKDTADDAGWKSVWQKLGAPEKPEGYKFDGVKLSSDDATKAFVDHMRGVAAQANMPAQMAEAVAKAAAEHFVNRDTAAATELQAKVKNDEDAIKANWGSNFDANKFVADRGAAVLAEKMGARLGVKLPELMQLAKDNGLLEVASELMRVVGVGYGEDKLIRATGAGGNEAMTKDQATVRKEELFRDQGWVQRYSKGDAAAKRELLAINTIIAGA